MNQLVSEIALKSKEAIRSNVSSKARNKTYTACVVSRKPQLEDALRLRYASYLDSGFIEPNPDRLFQDDFDKTPNATTIVVFEDGNPVASVRVCFMSWSVRNAPAHHAFPNEVDRILSCTRRSKKTYDVAEITRLVRSPDSANNQGLVFLLYRLAGHLVLRQDVQAILSSVRRNHIPFYRRLGFSDVAGPRAYPGLSCPMHLLHCARADYDRVRAAFPLMDPDATPAGSFEGFVAGRTIDMPLTFGG